MELQLYGMSKSAIQHLSDDDFAALETDKFNNLETPAKSSPTHTSTPGRHYQLEVIYLDFKNLYQEQDYLVLKQCHHQKK